MKRIILFVLLFAALKVAGQTTGYLRYDTVKIMKQNGTCELYVINKTKDSLGLLTNVGGGLTRFIKSKMLNDSIIIIGLDTIVIRGASGGQNISNASLTANGDYTQNWNRHQLIIDTTTDVRIYSDAPDWNFTNNNHTFLFEHYNSVIGSPPLSLKWSLRNVTNSSDSVGGGIVSSLYSTIVSHNTGSQSGQLYLGDGTAQLAGNGAKTSTITAYQGTITLDAADSILARLKPSATIAGDSMVVSRNFGFGLNTLYKVPVPSGGSATLSNVGSGFRLVKTAGGQVKTLFGGYGITPDSSSNTDGITLKADTSSTNHLVTQSDLNDASVAMRVVDTIQVHTSGTTITVSTGVNILYIDPASTLATLTITLPATPNHTGTLDIFFGGTLTSGNVVTAITISPNSGQSKLEASTPGYVEAGEHISYQYRVSNSKWYRKY